MSSKNRKTLETIFANPANGNIPWDQIESLFVSVGCRVIEGSGFSVTF